MDCLYHPDTVLYPYNMGKMTNKGFELEASADILTGRVKWTLRGNIYLNRNKVDDISGNELLGTSILQVAVYSAKAYISLKPVIR